MASRRARGAWRLLICFPLAFMFGCAVDTFGLVAVEAKKYEQAYIVDSYPVGMQIRARGDDRGVTLGSSKRRYIYRPDVNGKLSPGWHFFRAPLPEEKALAVHASSIGLELGVNGGGLQGTFGWQEFTALSVAMDQDAILRLRYEPARPERTRARFCEGRQEC